MNDQHQDLASRFQTAYTILFLLIIFVAALTWIVPAGQYERVMNATGAIDTGIRSARVKSN